MLTPYLPGERVGNGPLCFIFICLGGFSLATVWCIWYLLERPNGVCDVSGFCFSLCRCWPKQVSIRESSSTGTGKEAPGSSLHPRMQ